MTDISYHGHVAVFDLDDTLAPEHRYLQSAFRHAARYLKEILSDSSVTVDEREIVALMNNGLEKGPFYYDSLEEWLSEQGLDPKVIMPGLVESVHNHLPETEYSLSEEARLLLESLRRKGIKMALVTDGRSTTQRQKIKALGLDEFFHPDLIFISEEQGADKTKPTSFIKIVRSFPEASGFSYTGDNPAKDFEHPNLLGWQTYCLMASKEGKNIFSQPDRPFPYGANQKISSLSDHPLLG